MFLLLALTTVFATDWGSTMFDPAVLHAPGTGQNLGQTQ